MSQGSQGSQGTEPANYNNSITPIKRKPTSHRSESDEKRYNFYKRTKRLAKLASKRSHDRTSEFYRTYANSTPTQKRKILSRKTPYYKVVRIIRGINKTLRRKGREKILIPYGTRKTRKVTPSSKTFAIPL